jgi:hypothetical protein
MSTVSVAKSRLLNQFSRAFDLQALIESIGYRFEDTDQMLDNLRTKRDINTATGVWLDILGDIVGVERPYKELSADNIFTFKSNPADPDDPDKAYYDPGGPTGGYYQSAEGLRDPSGDLIDDTEYRKIIKGKAYANHVIGNIDDIGIFIRIAYGSVVSNISDDIPGEIEIELGSALTQGQRRLVERYAPAAAGVNLTIINWP